MVADTVNLNDRSDLSMSLGIHYARDSNPGAKRSLDWWLKKRQAQMPLSNKVEQGFHKVYASREPERVAYWLNLAMEDASESHSNRDILGQSIDRAQTHSSSPLEQNPVYFRYLKKIDATYKASVGTRIDFHFSEAIKKLKDTTFNKRYQKQIVKESVDAARRQTTNWAEKIYFEFKNLVLWSKLPTCKTFYRV